MNSDLSYIHPEAKIGKNVKIEAFAWIDKNVVIGDGTWIGSNATIMEGARIGKNCQIFPGATSVLRRPPKFCTLWVCPRRFWSHCGWGWRPLEAIRVLW